MRFAFTEEQDELRRQARALLDEREPTWDELAELGRTFNAMLDRLEAAFDTQRSFVSDASHELRTPITIVRGHLELLGDDPEERRETIALVTDELDRPLSSLLPTAKPKVGGLSSLEEGQILRLTRTRTYSYSLQASPDGSPVLILTPPGQDA